MADEKALDRVRKLIQLSASSNLAEAKQAAYKACAMIREIGLDVCDPDEIDGVFKQLADEQAKVKQLEAGSSRDDEDEDDYSRSWPNVNPSNYVGVKSKPITRHGQYSAARPNSFSQAGYHPPPAVPADPVDPIHLKSRFAGKCKLCSKPFKVNDPVLWVPKVGCFCPTSSCFQDWQARNGTVAGFNPTVTP